MVMMNVLIIIPITKLTVSITRINIYMISDQFFFKQSFFVSN